MISKEFLESCTDEQINKGVGWIEIIRLSRMLPSYCVNAGNIGSGASAGLLKTNYCANPNDTMPIAFANDIEFLRRRGIGEKREFIASKNLINSVNKNPYRAICEVYILMSVNKVSR